MLLILHADEQAFSLLYDRYAARMLRFLCRMLQGDEDRAQDLLHELFLKLIEKPERYDSRQLFAPWFYRLAWNLCLNDIRDRKNRLRLLKSDVKTSYQDSYIAEEMDGLLFQKEFEKMTAGLEAEQQLLL